jgi:hypothetical protein
MDSTALASKCQRKYVQDLRQLNLMWLAPPPPLRHTFCPCCRRIDPTALASECQRKYACSTTLEDLPGKHNPGQAVILQVGAAPWLAAIGACARGGGE